MQELARVAYGATDDRLYSVGQKTSHVSKEFAAGDPEFWTPADNLRAASGRREAEKAPPKRTAPARDQPVSYCLGGVIGPGAAGAELGGVSVNVTPRAAFSSVVFCRSSRSRSMSLLPAVDRYVVQLPVRDRVAGRPRKQIRP